MKPKNTSVLLHAVCIYVCLLATPMPTYTQEDAYAPGVLEQKDPEVSEQQIQPESIPPQEAPDKKSLPLSAVLPLSGPGGIIGQQLFDGMNLYFNKIKNDPKTRFSIKLNSQDSKSDGPKALKYTQKLLKTSPIFLSSTGTDALSMTCKDNTHQKILNLFPVEGIESLRGERYKNLIYYRPAHKKELHALVNYVTTKLNKKKIALFYEASDWGEAILTDMQDILKESGIKLVEQAAYAQKTVNIGDAVSAITKSAPNVIFCISQDRPAYHFIQEVLNKGLHHIIFVGLSNLFSIQKTLRKSRGVQIILSSVVPDPILSQLEIAKEYREDMKKYLPNKNLTPFSFEGYINAALAYQYIQQTGTPVTKTTLTNTIENTPNFNFKGLNLQFDKQTNTLSNAIWINTGKEKKEWFLAPNTR